MSECERAGKWIGGCRFEPRYDVGVPSITTQEAAVLFEEMEAFVMSRPSTYIHDICIRCGKIVEPTVTITNELAPSPTQEPSP